MTAHIAPQSTKHSVQKGISAAILPHTPGTCGVTLSLTARVLRTGIPKEPGRTEPPRQIQGSAQISASAEVWFHFFQELSLSPPRLQLQGRITHPSLTRHSAVPPAGISAPQSFWNQAPATRIPSNTPGPEGCLFHYDCFEHLKSFLQELDSFRPCAKYSKQFPKPSAPLLRLAPVRSTK